MAKFLAGPATLLFTDIEGSTRLLKQLRGDYAEVLSEHRRLLRDAFTARGGREVDTQGDSFFFVFPTPRDALLAAVDGQRAIATHTWPEGADVRVRMGIHTGGAAYAEDRYHGVAVHRAARISAAAHGGQILLSQTTQSLLEDEEEEIPGVELRDLGEHRFKGFDRPRPRLPGCGGGSRFGLPTDPRRCDRDSRVDARRAADGRGRRDRRSRR